MAPDTRLEEKIERIRQGHSALLAEKSLLMKRPVAMKEIASAFIQLRLADQRNDLEERTEWAHRLAAWVLRYMVDCAP